MDTKEIIEFLEKTKDGYGRTGVVATTFTGSFVGYATLIDELYQEYLEDYKKEVVKVYKGNYQGGWDAFENNKRAEYVERYVRFLKSHNIEIDSIDFFSDSTLFLNFKKTPEFIEQEKQWKAQGLI